MSPRQPAKRKLAKRKPAKRNRKRLKEGIHLPTKAKTHRLWDTEQEGLYVYVQKSGTPRTHKFITQATVCWHDRQLASFSYAEIEAFLYACRKRAAQSANRLHAHLGTVLLGWRVVLRAMRRPSLILWPTCPSRPRPASRASECDSMANGRTSSSKPIGAWPTSLAARHRHPRTL